MNFFGPETWFFVKIMIVVFMGLYTVFAFVVIKQVQLMISTLELGFEWFIKISSYVHFIIVVFLLIASLIVL